MRLIDADALIEKLDEMQLDTAYLLDNEDVGIARARDVVESFPTASQWISVDERLPEIKNVHRFELGGKTYETSNSDCVLIMDNLEGLGLGYYCRNGWRDVSDEIDPEDITRWMEIPE